MGLKIYFSEAPFVNNQNITDKFVVDLLDIINQRIDQYISPNPGYYIIVIDPPIVAFTPGTGGYEELFNTGLSENVDTVSSTLIVVDASGWSTTPGGIGITYRIVKPAYIADPAVSGILYRELRIPGLG